MPEEQPVQETLPVEESVTEQPEDQQSDQPQEGEAGKTFNSDYVEKLRKEAAKYRTEAKQNAAAAKELANLKESQKTELEKAVERADSAEGALGALKAAEQIREWKAEAAKKFGVPVDALRGVDLGEIEEHAATLKALLPEPRKPGQVPTEGRTVLPGSGDPATQFAEILRSARK